MNTTLIDTVHHSLTPLLLEAKKAHQEKNVIYNDNGTITFSHPDFFEKIIIEKDHQYPLIRPTFDDLNKALSSTANSPLYSGKKTLRQLFEEELKIYEELVEKTYDANLWEPDYGIYVFDQFTKNLYLIAPEFWHRLGLVTNNSKLLTDPKEMLSWAQIREIFDNVVVGFVGASVGGNVLEGICRDIRPKRAKVADPDWVEITNLNRFERGSMQYLSQSRAKRFDARSPYDVVRMNKAEIASYEQYLIDPYSTWYVYSEGLHKENIEQFLLGNGNEPRIDVLIEEADDLRLKVELRELCRKHKIPVLMMSDFGHLVEGQFQDFKHDQKQQLGYKIQDNELYASLDKAMSSGKREDRFAFVKDLCGPEFETDEFGRWVKGEGEQPTSSLPQSGTVAMASGGIGAKTLALYLLGHKVPKRFIYDLRRWKVDVEF